MDERAGLSRVTGQEILAKQLNVHPKHCRLQAPVGDFGGWRERGSSEQVGSLLAIRADWFSSDLCEGLIPEAMHYSRLNFPERDKRKARSA